MNTLRLTLPAALLTLSSCGLAGPPLKTIEPYTPVSTTPSDTAACRLFDPALLAEPKFKNGYASVSDCYWGSDHYGTLVISVRDAPTPEAFLHEPKGMKASPITIGAHSGVLAENARGDGTCSVVLTHPGGITAAEVGKEPGGRACEVAQAVMKVVEPKLS